MRTIVLLASLLLGANAPVLATDPQPKGWVDAKGKAETEARKSLNGFAGMLLVTPDADWKEKWEQPENPSYNTTDEVALGGSVWTLILFSNPGKRADGTIDVRCDVKVTRGDGTISVDEKDLPCGEGELPGDPHNLRLAHVTPGFKGEEGDPQGRWIVEVRLTDAVNHVTLELKTGFDFHKP